MIFYTNMAYFGKITFIIGHNFVIKRSELVFLLYLNIKSKAFFMRKVIVMFALLFLSVGAWAQYAGSGTIRRVGSHIEMDGERLSPEARTGKPLITAGLITAGLGIVSAGVGIPLLVKSNKTLSGVVDTYNNGIGLALRF